MIDLFRGYVVTKDKRCLERFKFEDGNRLHTYDEIKHLSEYAGILNGEWTVIDIDDKPQAEVLYDICQKLKLNIRIYPTKRGMHFVFKNSDAIVKNGVKQWNAIGLQMDIRYGKNAYIMCKHNNIERVPCQDFDESRPIAEVPFWLMPIGYGDKHCPELFCIQEGDGRQERLFKHVGKLARLGMKKDEIIKTCKIINKCIFAKPMDEQELKHTYRDEVIENASRFTPKGTFDLLDDFGEPIVIKPAEFSDSGVAEVLYKCYGNSLRFCPATGWLVWNGKTWEMSDIKAQGVVKKLTGEILDDAKSKLKNLYKKLENDVDDESPLGKGTATEIKKQIAIAKKYYEFALKNRNYPKTANILGSIKSDCLIDITELNKNPFLLNTPKGIVDLKTGEISKHTPKEYCTKITKFTPSNKGDKEWRAFLNDITCGDEELQEYLQYVAGQSALGKVYYEAMIIAYGGGKNGKSTLFNTLATVMGDYAGKIPAEALTTRAKSVKVDLAELLGKRLVIASETDEGQRLSTSMLKQIASVDPITAERKYCDPFVFIPSHTVVLYTNHLPKVGSGDNGTWRRLAVTPFNAKFDNPKLDFAEKLLETSGEAIMQWIIDGAKKFIDNKYNLPKCTAVEVAIYNYKANNDWLGNFLEECCDLGNDKTAPSGELYLEYKMHTIDINEYVRSVADFTAAMEAQGFERKKTNKGVLWLGIEKKPLFSQ